MALSNGRLNSVDEQKSTPDQNSPTFLGSSGVVWITGLSGAGKSTIARQLVSELRVGGGSPVLLDGDEVRDAISDPTVGHDRTSRLANAYRICRLARLISTQGFTVVVATMSLFKEVHDWNRRNLPNYFEVFVEVSLETLRQRDARGLYSRAAQGKATNVVGLDLEFDRPTTPHLTLRNEGGSILELCQDILRQLPAATSKRETLYRL